LVSLSVTGPAAESAYRPGRATQRIRYAVAFAGLAIFMVAVQFAVGAYRTERGNYSDEAAHFLNGFLISEYVTHAAGHAPLPFAEKFYTSYPKVALGMWPPLFHGLLGVFLLPGWPPQPAALVLLGLITAWMALRLYQLVRLYSPPAMAMLVSALFMVTPATVNLMSAVMLDIVVAWFALEATYWFAIFLRTHHWRHGALYGVFTACACLTKGNGVAVVFVPPVMMLLSGQFDLFRRGGLYLAAAIVVVFAVPLLSLSFYLDAAIGDFGAVRWADVINRSTYYGAYLRTDVGVLPVALSLAGLMVLVRRTSDDAGRARFAAIASLEAMSIAALLFHLLNPHTVYSGRYLTLAIAPILGLAPFGIDALTAWMRSTSWRLVAQAALVCALVANVALVQAAVIERQPLGFRAAVDRLQESGLDGRRMLIASDENGEGAFVTEVAVRKAAIAPIVIRSSKMLGTDNWAGHHFSLRYESPDAVLRALEDLHVDWLVVDYSPGAMTMRFWPQMRELVEENADRLELVAAVSGVRPVYVYRLKYQSAGAAKDVSVAVDNPLTRWLRR